MRSLDWQKIQERLLEDFEFGHAARRWTTTLRLDIGDSSHRLTFSDGRLQSIEDTAADDSSELFISAPESDWEALLAPVPRPFYQELAFAAAHHDFTLNPEPRDYAAYYPAYQRLIQILREEADLG